MSTTTIKPGQVWKKGGDVVRPRKYSESDGGWWCCIISDRGGMHFHDDDWFSTARLLDDPDDGEPVVLAEGKIIERVEEDGTLVGWPLDEPHSSRVTALLRQSGRLIFIPRKDQV